jgi:hypothetical protein
MAQEFVDGLFVNRKENAPEFVKASLSFKVENFVEYLNSKANAKGYVNIDILESREGKLYAKLNDWKPKQEEVEEEEEEEITSENIPF